MTLHDQATYRAVVFDDYGGPEVLRLAELEATEPGEGQVRVAVRAAGVNPLDWKLRDGLMREFAPLEFPSTPGVELAGVIDRVGPGVTEFAVGDEVLGSASGGYTELAVADAANLTKKPAGLDWVLAAGLPVVATTTYRVLALLDPAPGDTLLIDGAAGGVGTIAVQIARQRGLTVIGTASQANHEYLRSLGAIPVTYGDGLVQRVRAVAPNGVQVALDASGRGSLPALIELTGSPDRVITIADGAAGQLGVRFTGGSPEEDVPGALAQAAALVAAGTVSLPIARTYPLAEAATAQRDSKDGHVRGKLVLLVG